MANKRVGKRTVKLQNNPTIISAASVVGPKEGQGPLKEYFNLILQDDLYGEKSWELAESKMVQTAMHMAAQKAGKKLEDINYLIGGDLINQILPSSFAARELGIPFFGIYGACSTMAEGMCLSAMLIDGGFADLILSRNLPEEFISQYGRTSDDVSFPYYSIPYGSFIVDSCKRQSDMRFRKVIAYGKTVSFDKLKSVEASKQARAKNRISNYKF